MIIFTTVLLLSGCVGQEKTAEEKQPDQDVAESVDSSKQLIVDNLRNEKNNSLVSIEEVGYTIRINEMERPFVYYGIIIKNNNKVKTVTEPTIVLSLKDDNGKVYMEQEQTLQYIAPDDTVIYSGIVDCGDNVPADIKFSCKFSEDGKGEEINVVKSSDLKIIDAKEELTNNTTIFTGEIQNLSQQDMSMVEITVLIKNKGKIVMGTNTYVMELNHGESLNFELQERDLPEHDEVIFSALPFTL